MLTAVVFLCGSTSIIANCHCQCHPSALIIKIMPFVIVQYCKQLPNKQTLPFQISIFWPSYTEHHSLQLVLLITPNHRTQFVDFISCCVLFYRLLKNGGLGDVVVTLRCRRPTSTYSIRMMNRRGLQGPTFKASTISSIVIPNSMFDGYLRDKTSNDL